MIDAGSLQVMEADFIPQNAILTPNKKEFKMLLGHSADQMPEQTVSKLAKKHQCVIVLKRVEMMPSEEQTFTLEILLDEYLEEFTHYNFEIFFEDEIRVSA